MNVRPAAVRILAFLLAGLAATKASQAQVAIDAEAYRGTPFGVGRITLRSGGDFRINRIPRLGGPRDGRIGDLARRVIDQMNRGDVGELQSAELALREKSNRTLYPVFQKRDRPVLREFVNVPTEATIFFLFQGDAPLELTVYTPELRAGRVAPVANREGHARLLEAWWRDFAAAADSRDAAREYPPVVEEYLMNTLARRLNLPLPRRLARAESSPLMGQLNLLFETETARLELTQAILLGEVAHRPADQAIPEELPAPKPELLNPPADTPIEPIARRVPVECLYVRFGNFPNFLWLRHRMDDWGGELRDIISERGLDFGLNAKFQRQMGLRESALAEVLGDKVIADVAMIGTDMSMREGATLGMLFHAKSNQALTADLTQQRLTAMRETKSAAQEKLTIAGKQVSYISTPDGVMRSYYVVDGDFHLVTNSRTLVEWFLATGNGGHPSLGESDEFRYTRANMPLERNDSVFVYLSPQFFQNLLSAPYQIELQRRLRSAVEIELLQIAQLTARGEGQPSGTIAELTAGGYLPEGFGQRPDGSSLQLDGGQIVDSARGARGTFVSALDRSVDKVAPEELADYQRFSRTYAEQWGRMAPVVIGIGRQALPEGQLERVTLDIQAAPLSQRHLDKLGEWLGEPTDQRLARVPGDVVSFEAVLRGGSLAQTPEHHLFGALRNADPAITLDSRPGLLARIVTAQLQGLQGYVGAWPNPGLLSIIGGASDILPDQAGYSRLRTGLWRRQVADFTLLSFHPQILEQVSPQLRFEKAARPAQVWLHAEDLTRSSLAPMLNAYGWRQSQQITRGNTRFLNMLTDQLHVPPAEALATGERLLQARFVAPLGGTYELRDVQGLKTWVATSLVERGGNQPPSDYQFPALNWLRGMDFELRVQDGMLAAHAEVIMPAKVREPAFKLPNLPFGRPKPAAAPPKPKTPQPMPPPDAEELPAPRGAVPAPGAAR